MFSSASCRLHLSLQRDWVCMEATQDVTTLLRLSDVMAVATANPPTATMGGGGGGVHGALCLPPSGVLFWHPPQGRRSQVS